MKLNKEEVLSIIGYVFVSLSATGLDFLFFNIFDGFFERFFPLLYITIATVLSRIISDTYKYLMDHHAVFKAKGSSGILKYYVLATSKTLLSSLFVTILVFTFGNHDVIFKMIVDLTIFFPAYFIEKIWVHGVKH